MHPMLDQASPNASNLIGKQRINALSAGLLAYDKDFPCYYCKRLSEERHSFFLSVFLLLAISVQPRKKATLFLHQRYFSSTDSAKLNIFFQTAKYIRGIYSFFQRLFVSRIIRPLHQSCRDNQAPPGRIRWNQDSTEALSKASALQHTLLSLYIGMPAAAQGNP